MGLFFTLFYLFAAYIGPPVLFGDLAQYHIEVALALFTLIFSLPAIQDSGLLSISQTYGLIGLSAAVAYSIAFNGWVAGAPTALIDFLPSALVFFFVALNCKKKIHLQLLIAVLLAAVFYTIYRGYMTERAGVEESLYVITMKNNAGENFFRIRGATFLNDPNDLAQFLVALVPCVFFFWVKGRSFRNLMLVYLPVSVLLFGMYLTHSRGGMIALMAAAVVAGRRKFGLMRSVVLGVILFVGLSVGGFSGGRDVSTDAGEDRMDAWAAGLQMIRQHPFKGVGIGRFTDFHEITAHNTVILCAAELGLPGFFFWVLFVLPSVRETYVGSEGGRLKKPKADKAGDLRGLRIPDGGPAAEPLPTLGFPRVALAAAGGERPLLQRSVLQGVNERGREAVKPRMAAEPYNGALDSATEENDLTDDEIRRLCSLMVISFAGFLTAGWFLARAYTMTMFLLAGMGHVVYRMASDRKIAPPDWSFGRAAKLSVVTCVVLIMAVWISLRVHHF
jgi:O-antigen ligase